LNPADVRRGVLPPYRLPVFAACLTAALVCCYVLGKDMASDTLNYHLYAGFSALNYRFGQDYFAAGPTAYFNPSAYIPFYLMVRAGLPALLIGSVFSVIHSIILWLTFELGVAISPSSDTGTRMLAGACAAVLAFMNPILMQEIGSCFADITTAEIALAGWLLLALAIRRPRISLVVWAGLLLGAATALKLNNAIHTIAASFILVMLPLTWASRLRYGLLYGISSAASFTLVSLPWSYQLERIFGNPMFPIFNGIFRSPEFTTEPLLDHRFIPESLAQALWRPFAMIDPARMVHEELSAPDLRYAVLLTLFLIISLRWLWRHLSSPSDEPMTPLSVSTRILGALGLAFSVDWVVWLRGSGNSRYILTLACVAGVLVIGLLFRLFANRPKVRNYALAAIFAVQATQLSIGAEYRWKGATWGGPWFDVAVPLSLQTDPNLFLTLGIQSNSFIAPYLAGGSALVNFSGGYELSADGANGARIKALIKRYAPHLRMLVTGANLYEDADNRMPRRTTVNDALMRFGLQVDMRDCSRIALRGLPPEIELGPGSPDSDTSLSPDTTYLVSCRIIPDDSDQSVLAARQREVDLVFTHLEDACPKLFQPRGLTTQHDGDVWRRRYPSTDLTAWVSYGTVKAVNPARGADGMIRLGGETEWSKAPLHLDCGRRNGVYFARVLNHKGPKE
jgi:hypothetical protein